MYICACTVNFGRTFMHIFDCVCVYILTWVCGWENCVNVYINVMCIHLYMCMYFACKCVYVCAYHFHNTTVALSPRVRRTISRFFLWAAAWYTPAAGLWTKRYITMLPWCQRYGLLLYSYIVLVFSCLSFVFLCAFYLSIYLLSVKSQQWLMFHFYSVTDLK